ILSSIGTHLKVVVSDAADALGDSNRAKSSPHCGSAPAGISAATSPPRSCAALTNPAQLSPIARLGPESYPCGSGPSVTSSTFMLIASAPGALDLPVHAP